MRKRWVWIGVAATALILAVFALLTPSDGLDFIRSYGPKREYLTKGPNHGVDNFRRITFGDNWTRTFEFEKVPAQLKTELQSMGTVPKGSSPYHSPFMMVGMVFFIRTQMKS
ncbi:MAG: hypothetical protein H7Y17_14955 [Chlorobia bacterium]|nr:hypothetical protein [Fimbriimonadaceae bacterium]